jgi:hypothetical protein
MKERKSSLSNSPKFRLSTFLPTSGESTVIVLLRKRVVISDDPLLATAAPEQGRCDIMHGRHTQELRKTAGIFVPTSCITLGSSLVCQLLREG